MSLITFIDDLDAYAYRLKLPKTMAIFMIFLYPALWAIGVYRFGNWVVNKCKIPIIKQILFIVYFILKRLTEMITDIEIGATAEIGGGLYLGHNAVTIGDKSIIGRNASFHRGITVGGAGRGDKYGHPKIGDNVYFGAGCAVIGKINIGNNVLIGANAAVVKDVPDNAVVGGVPACILNYNGSYGLLHYRDF